MQLSCGPPYECNVLESSFFFLYDYFIIIIIIIIVYGLSSSFRVRSSFKRKRKNIVCQSMSMYSEYIVNLLTEHSRAVGPDRLINRQIGLPTGNTHM